jgi:hypothetical protein
VAAEEAVEAAVEVAEGVAVAEAGAEEAEGVAEAGAGAEEAGEQREAEASPPGFQACSRRRSTAAQFAPGRSPSARTP